MSFYRLIFYSAVIGGWAAFAGWLFGELFFMRRAPVVGYWSFVSAAALVGGVIAGGLSMLAAAATGRWIQQIPRALVGLGGGLVGGALGGLVGNVIYSLYEASITRPSAAWTAFTIACPKKFATG